MKEDLLSHFYAIIFKPSINVPIKHLNKDSFLNIRLESFLGNIQVDSDKDEILAELEKAKDTSYSFDDCLNTLNSNHSNLYEKVKENIYLHLKNSNTIEAEEINEGLITLRDSFQNLLKSIP